MADGTGAGPSSPPSPSLHLPIPNLALTTTFNPRLPVRTLPSPRVPSFQPFNTPANAWLCWGSDSSRLASKTHTLAARPESLTAPAFLPPPHLTNAPRLQNHTLDHTVGLKER